MNEFDYESELSKLNRSLENRSVFQLEEDVTSFLIRFPQHSGDWRYRLLARRLFLEVWKKRLLRSTSRQWFIESKVEELQHRAEKRSHYLDLAHQIPCLEDIIGIDWLHRERKF